MQNNMEQMIRKIVQEELQKQTIENQFAVNLSPIHTHSLTDSSGGQIPISSIVESFPITGTLGGVFDPVILDTQKVNNEYISSSNYGKKYPQAVYILPINIIYGHGGGTASAFNGGDAEPGTMVFFENSTLSGLWINTINGWRGVNFPLSI